MWTHKTVPWRRARYKAHLDEADALRQEIADDAELDLIQVYDRLLRSGLLGVPLIGAAAAIGLTLFFVGAIITHLQARDYSLGFPVAYLLLAVAVLVLDLAT